MLFLPVLFTAIYRTAIYYIVLRYICQLSDFFPRLRWSLATSTLYAVVRILAERFLLCMKTISCKVKSTEQILHSMLLMFFLKILKIMLQIIL